MVQVRVQGLAVVAQEVAPVVLLREETGLRRWLAITIGAPEAQELAAAQEQVVSARPGTVELILEVLSAFGQHVERVEVTELRDSIFHADLVLSDGVRVSARPSDAIAVGLRAHAPIEVAEDVLAEAAVDVTVAGGDDPAEALGGDPAESSEDQIRQFRDLLDEVSPDDFRDPGPA
ncbi:bifunctional nuclease family protein [Amycolatopsis sp. FDAARGOS 1241]|uniref:bifunctional nuclease family protein n=1 Tax=Amycolatopsis sp. FDAARGOS 1241 TaxID=2778070 RepID=UPI0019523C7D|nr:bifunctional nuclease family protein [Amycolatopsis sp. FDAARGOS 1241]QRP49317.1 bifunctional nuclease family protein [Amycolatopsis sp. FDAARGOS 1241]